MEFEPRTIVNGTLLKRHPGQAVSIHLFVERADKDGRSFSGKSTDGVQIQVKLSEPLRSLLQGWVEVIGMVGSNDTVQCKEIITYEEVDGQEEFDANAHNMLCTFLATCRDMYRMG